MSKTKVIYSQVDYERDSKSFDNAVNGKSRLDLGAFRRLMVHDLCTNTDILRSYKVGNYPLERIQEALNNPVSHSNMIIEVLLSRDLTLKVVAFCHQQMRVFNQQ